MVVTEIVPLVKGKSKIYINGEFCFVLYKGEVNRYGIKVDEEISAETYEEIINMVIIKRAKARSLYLLKDMDRTEYQLRTKLRQNHYKDDVIGIVIDYVKSYHYIDDIRYASNYISSRSKYKSKRQIIQELIAKGISKDIIDERYETEEIDEKSIIKKHIEKKKIDLETASQKEIHKLYMSLLRKGFSSQEIRTVIKAGIEDNIDDEFYY